MLNLEEDPPGVEGELAELGEAEAGEGDVPDVGVGPGPQDANYVLLPPHPHHGVHQHDVVLCRA